MITINKNNHKNEWDAFINGASEIKCIRKEILDSWKRCRGIGIDIENSQGRLLAVKEYFEMCERDHDLLTYSRPIIQSLFEMFDQEGTLLLVINRDEVIINIVGNTNELEEAKKNTYQVGALWSEEVVGTNASSLSIRYNKPFKTDAYEHYSKNHKRFSCCAVPIYDDDNIIVGTLVSTVFNKDSNSHSLGMVQAGAQLITNELKHSKLIQFMENGLNSITEAVIVLDSFNKISFTSQKVSAYLGIGESKLKNQTITKYIFDLDFDEISSSRYNIGFKLGSDAIPCTGNVIFLDYLGKKIGLAIVFRKDHAVNKYINRMMGNTAHNCFDDIITNDQIMQKKIADAKKISKINCAVLISGESGTGKELFAQSIHNHSKRKEGPFIAVNCAALPQNLVESELFGYEGGSFTNADRNGRPGKFELASGGTLFLDEIGELPIDIQPKLLRALDTGKINRIGSKTEKAVDVRVISATNRNIEDDVKSKNFRLDLLYRINTMKIHIPSLRERKGDIRLLSEFFLERLNSENDTIIDEIAPDFINSMLAYPFEGNVRELQNIVSRAYFLCESNRITCDLLPNEFKSNEHQTTQYSEPEYKEDFTLEDGEKAMIIRAINHCSGNITKAAKQLNIGKATIYRKIKKYNIQY